MRDPAIRGILLACLSAALTGCPSRTPAPPPVVIAPPTPASVIEDEDSLSTTEAETAVAIVENNTTTDTTVDTTREIAKRQTEELDRETTELTRDVEPQKQLAPAERIMLLTESGPLLIDLHITIQGIPYQQCFDTAINGVLAIADDDKDGVVTWDDIMTHRRFSAGQFGNPASTTYQAQQDMTRLYDTTQNGRVDNDELVRYLTSNQSTSRPIALYTSNYRRVQNRDDSPIRKWLDVNDDFVIDKQEIAAASQRLRLRDANDDEILLPADFIDANLIQPGQPMRRRPRDSEYLPNVGWEVRDGEPWSDMRVAWNHFYSVGQDVRADDLTVGADLYKQMDLDENNYLDNIEMEMLAEVEPHIAIEMDLVATEEGKQPEIKLAALRLPNEQMNAVLQHQPDRITIQLPQTTLDIFARDSIGYVRFEDQAMNFLQQADGDENSYLDEDEFGAVTQFLNVEFAGADLDDNEKVFQDEIVAVLEQRNIVNRNQIRIRADDQEDALLPSIDANSDGRLDSREIADVAEALLSLDQNDDGEIQLHELRGAMMLGVVRGGGTGPIFQGDTTFQIPTVTRNYSNDIPRWFNGMDRNRDGSISWREFLGSRSQFDELDQNDDGFVATDEIAE